MPQGFQRITGAMTLVASLLMAPAALASDTPFPRVTGSISVEIQNDLTFKADDRDLEQNELGTLTEPSFSFWLTEGFSISTGLVLEAVTDPAPREDRFFEGHGFYVEVLTASYESDRFSLYAGKFGPNFSLAFDAAAGVYGTDMSEDDIELAEFVGFGGSYVLGETGLGRLDLSASVFTADRSILSNSVFKERGRVRLADGGPGNTSGLESFVIGLDATDVPGADGLRYHLAYAQLATETGPAEKRLVASVEWALALGNGVTLTPLVEYVRFWHAGGDAEENRHYITASILAERGPWNLALSFTGRRTNHALFGQHWFDHQLQVSAGYAFENGLSVDLGYKTTREMGEQAHTLGLLLAWGHDF